MYTPDNWVVVKINPVLPCYKVLAGWYGNFTAPDEWRLNSGITDCTESEDFYFFISSSGSVYRCSKLAYGLRTNNAYIFDKFQKQFGEKHFELMPEDTNWLEMNWGLKSKSVEDKLIDKGDYT